METPASLQPIKGSQLKEVQAAVERYQKGVTREAAEWFKARGLDLGTVRMFRLGVVNDPPPAHRRYTGWVSIPYMVNDEPVAVRFRCIKEHSCRELSHGKYGQPTGEKVRTFNVDAIKRPGLEIHVTEGEFDCMILTQIGLPAIAMPGANSFAPRHARMLAGFSRVWVWGDPDDAGAEFASSITNRLPYSARALNLINGDVNETFLRGGAQALQQILADAKHLESVNE